MLCYPYVQTVQQTGLFVVKVNLYLHVHRGFISFKLFSINNKCNSKKCDWHFEKCFHNLRLHVFNDKACHLQVPLLWCVQTKWSFKHSGPWLHEADGLLHAAAALPFIWQVVIVVDRWWMAGLFITQTQQVKSGTLSIRWISRAYSARLCHYLFLFGLAC